MSRDARPGHRLLAHTADVRIESWGPTRERALDEAVAAFAETFVEAPAGSTARSVRRQVTGGSNGDLLVALLEEAVYLLDTTDLVPVSAVTTATSHGVDVEFRCLPSAEVTIVGSPPKGVSWHRLSCAGDADGWRCTATIDV